MGVEGTAGALAVEGGTGGEMKSKALYIPADVFRALKEKAQANGESVRKLAARALRRELDRRPPPKLTRDNQRETT